MNAQKAADQPSAKSGAQGQGTRKPWKKKTPADVILDQITRVRDDVAKKEEELKQARHQLQKLEEVRKVLESA